jgi:hypothetical protein
MSRHKFTITYLHHQKQNAQLISHSHSCHLIMKKTSLKSINKLIGKNRFFNIYHAKLFPVFLLKLKRKRKKY